MTGGTMHGSGPSEGGNWQTTSATRRLFQQGANLVRRRFAMLLVTVGMVLFPLAPLSMGQTESGSFHPRRGATVATLPSSQRVEAGVSADLLSIYQATKSARTPEEVTEIIDRCRDIHRASDRSAVDREYAQQLLAWGLNRRGELRSTMANQLALDGQYGEAREWDTKARQDFAEAVELEPENWRSRHNLAIALAIDGDFSSALEHISRALELNPNYANAYFNRAEFYFELGRFDDAASDYQRALELNPEDAQAFNGRAHCRFLLDDLEHALEDYQQAVRLAPTDAAMRLDLADMYQYLGKWEAAAEQYREAVKRNPQDARAYHHAAWLMATCPDAGIRNPQLAVASARKAIELAAEPSAELLETLAVALAATGDLQHSVVTAREALRRCDDEQLSQDLRRRIADWEHRLRRPPPSSSETTSGPPTALGQRPSMRTSESSRRTRK
ncbi:MAG: hypothetical protein KatS3mg111_4041 [Pirellulaceae bacterium]|nr:MAG: hypothetical protein KatS3mg111_4041 [Pirellulaceae bacterium]